MHSKFPHQGHVLDLSIAGAEVRAVPGGRGGHAQGLWGCRWGWLQRPRRLHIWRWAPYTAPALVPAGSRASCAVQASLSWSRNVSTFVSEPLAVSVQGSTYTGLHELKGITGLLRQELNFVLASAMPLWPGVNGQQSKCVLEHMACLCSRQPQQLQNGDDQPRVHHRRPAERQRQRGRVHQDGDDQPRPDHSGQQRHPSHGLPYRGTVRQRPRGIANPQ